MTPINESCRSHAGVVSSQMSCLVKPEDNIHYALLLQVKAHGSIKINVHVSW